MGKLKSKKPDLVVEEPQQSPSSDELERDDDLENEEVENDCNEEEEKDLSRDDDILNDPDFQNMSDSDGDDLPLFGNLSDDELEDDEDETGTFKERERKGGGRVTQVDDQFFKLADMEQFLDAEDRKEINKTEDEKDDGMELFEEDGDSNEKRVMYKEYFDKDMKAGDDASEEGDSDEAENDEQDEEDMEDCNDEKEDETNDKPRKFLLSDDEDDSTEAVTKSSHEVAEERLVRKISRLEEVAVGSKPWQLGGEVAASLRQENSLLAEHLDYDTAVRHAPVSSFLAQHIRCWESGLQA